jgi:hypothetical protein
MVLKDLKNGTAVVELPKRVSSGMEHVCYLFLLTLEHVRYLSYIGTYGWTYMDVCMYGYVRTHIMWIRACFGLK